MERRDRIEGGMWGLLVGDALGVPYEFHRPEHLPPRQAIEMEPPAGFARAHAGTPAGTWSDDGAQALCLLDSLLACGRLEPEDLGKRLLRWHDEGYFAVDGRVFDVGVQTATALRAIRDGTPAENAGGTSERSNGNGSLMRMLPLAIRHRGPDADLVADSFRQSAVTHGHPRAQVCCALYGLWARRVLDGTAPEPAWTEATEALRSVLPGNGPHREELETEVRPEDATAGRGQGYVVDCLRSARDAVSNSDSFESILKAAVALGHDTDTTACVAAGIAGLHHGRDAIPPRWMEALRGRTLAEPLIAAAATS